MDNEQERTYQAVLQAFRDFEAMRAPKQNVAQIYSGTIPAAGALTLPTTGDEMMLIVSGSTSTSKMYLTFGKSRDVPVGEVIDGAVVHQNVIQLYYNSNRYCSINLPVRSEYITLISGGSVLDFIVIFHTKNMGVRT